MTSVTNRLSSVFHVFLLLGNGTGQTWLDTRRAEIATLKEKRAACDHIVISSSGKQLSAVMPYAYEQLYSRPFITPGSNLPENLLNLSHSFGYDCRRRANLQLVQDKTLIFIAGQMLILFDVNTKQQRYIRSCSGAGIGAIGVHPSQEYFVVAEKGKNPILIVYEYPSLQVYRILRDGAERVFSSVNFNSDGSLLASLASAPDYLLTVWKWRQEEVMLRCKAISQEVFRVSFSPYDPGLLTSSGSGHIKFWRMASTFTGLKLEGLIGHFGKTPATDIEGYVELPDGKVVSGSNWGNLLLWEGNAIKVEICSKGGRCCHAGVVQPFALEDGQLMTFGSDGVIRGWDFETIDKADGSVESGKFEMEPANETTVWRHACLSSIVKTSQSDSTVWFAQDSNGAIWKVDLSFTYTTPDPQCLLSSHAGPIEALDVSKSSHLMATTTLDRSVRVYDFLTKRELVSSRFNQGGTALHWAPLWVKHSGGLLVTGFEDGVVRLLELYDTKGLHNNKGDAHIRLQQAFKPHNGPVTSVAYERNGKILATGSSDCTVFFFTVGEKYEPIGFVHVPGPVQLLEWSPHSHQENRLLILCQNAHIVEVPCPDQNTLKPTKSFQLLELPRRFFCFKSIKSQIKRAEEMARRQAFEVKQQQVQEDHQGVGEEMLEELPPIFIPNPRSPLLCGFYSRPGQFWLSMGGFDSGFLYHCKFSESQDENPDQRQDEPFDFLTVLNADNDAICSVTFNSNRQLMLCGMHSGSIRVYPLDPDNHTITSMQAFWELSIHDGTYGHLRHIRCSYDDRFVLTAGDDGNIFSFNLLPHNELQKELQRNGAVVPSPRDGLENEDSAQDIDDPAADNIETVQQKLEKDHRCREAEKKKSDKRRRLAEIRNIFKKLLKDNLELPEHSRLTLAELQLDARFAEQAEKEKTWKLKEVQKRMSWEEQHSQIALKKLQEWFGGSLESNKVTVFAIRTERRVSTYRIPALASVRAQQQSGCSESGGHETAPDERGATEDQTVKDAPETDGETEDDVPHPPVTRSSVVKLAHRQMERLRKAAEKAEQARAKIQKRKREWDKLYTEKPQKNREDPRDVQAICEARENVGDLKLKTDENFTVPKDLRMNADKKRAEMDSLETKVREKQTEMNTEIVALRDSKLRLLSKLRAEAKQFQRVRALLPSHLQRLPPPLPTIRPEEIRDMIPCTRRILEKYKALRDQRFRHAELEDQEGGGDLLKPLENEMGGTEGVGDAAALFIAAFEEGEEEEPEEEEAAELSELKESKLLSMQESILEKMESMVARFDKEHSTCLQKAQMLDWRLKLGHLRRLTLYQELLLLQEVDKREEILQEKLDARVKEENNLLSKLEECKEALELKRKAVRKAREKEKAVTKAFQASLGDCKNYEEYVTKVFKRKPKRVKKTEEPGEGEDDFDDYENWDGDDDDDWDALDGEAATDECPPGLESKLFEHILQLRERRLDLEELLTEEKKSADVLERERDGLVKKLNSVKITRQAAEDDLEQVNREKQQKMNQLHVVVPLKLHQIEFDITVQVPSDHSPALVLNGTELRRLRERVQQLEVEKRQQTEVYNQARQQHIKLIQERKDMNVEIQLLEKRCNQLMMRRFGREVDLEVLQTLSGNRTVEELKQEKLLQEAAYAKEIQQWDVKVEKAREALMEMTRSNTERLLRLNSLFEQRKELERKLDARRKKIGKRLQECSRRADGSEIWSLRELVRKQSQQLENLRREIVFLSRQGADGLAGGQTQLPPLAHVNKPTVQKHARKAGKANLNGRDGKAYD
ncbi:cilia- and flagella-associated protein 44-like isoform X2 [Hippocampus zosterae]|uniref:cilia- and flagella-associated protein 44-like isoform X2 n=1 Tax=Hippocampus zosterae TaxID=109293 RepID=UPI00223CF9E8|nr:cilia- and flagella-associated protein 44-like isoform X2 [Hippocampus zosterae]